MLAVKSIECRENFKAYCDKAVNGDTIIISRKDNKNVVMVSESEYNKLLEAKRISELLNFRAAVLEAEARRLAGAPTYKADEIFENLEKKYV